jgi:hypothetical protein
MWINDYYREKKGEEWMVHHHRHRKSVLEVRGQGLANLPKPTFP